MLLTQCLENKWLQRSLHTLLTLWPWCQCHRKINQTWAEWLWLSLVLGKLPCVHGAVLIIPIFLVGGATSQMFSNWKQNSNRKIIPNISNMAQLGIFFSLKKYVFFPNLFSLCGLPTFCLYNKETGSLLRVWCLRWQWLLPTTFAKDILLVLVVYGLRESSLHGHLARERGKKQTNKN